MIYFFLVNARGKEEIEEEEKTMSYFWLLRVESNLFKGVRYLFAPEEKLFKRCLKSSTTEPESKMSAPWHCTTPQILLTLRTIIRFIHKNWKNLFLHLHVVI